MFFFVWNHFPPFRRAVLHRLTGTWHHERGSDNADFRRSAPPAPVGHGRSWGGCAAPAAAADAGGGPCCTTQPRLQAVSAWPLVPPCMGTARTQPIPHILPPPCACRWPSALPCVSRLLPKIYCMTGTAPCRYCWMGLRYRGWMYAQHFADFIPYRTKLTKSCHWQSRTPYYNISLPSVQYTEYILLTERC